MDFPHDLKYTSQHEWLRLEAEQAEVGITDYAQDQLGDIVFLELPEPGRELKRDESFGVVESTKSVSDLYAPVSGKVLEVNRELLNHPELINQDPYRQGWLIKVSVTQQEELSQLLDAGAYRQLVEN